MAIEGPYHSGISRYQHESRPSLSHSTASAPSLRSRKSVYLPMGRPLREGPRGGNVKVVVRVRSFLPREIDSGAECLVEMDSQTEETKLLVPPPTENADSRTASRKIVEEKSFTFDKSFNSHDPSSSNYATQEDVYNSLGEEFLDHNFEGYNTCIFAYGQTGSGKSYTMMGSPSTPGLIPRTCQDLFERIESSESPSISYNVRVSYFEIYNEHVRDLLVPRTETPYYLKIRESPTEGPYVKDLTDQPVRSYEDILRLMQLGDASRSTAATKMNDTSSRSHAVFTIMLKQIHADLSTDETTERTARIRLVDLAGSERAKATEATGQRLREGSNINKSLTTLGRVIAALADNSNTNTNANSLAKSISSNPGTPRRGITTQRKELVPYRDSILTWLLKDSLGGNSKTAMIACISPSSLSYDETLSTLRYADQAKRIRTRAVVNQDSISSAERDAQILAMQETIRALQISVSTAAERRREEEGRGMQLEEYQKRVTEMQRLVEEQRCASECRIRALQEENEALRVHLRLAVESLKRPVVLPMPRMVSRAMGDEAFVMRSPPMRDDAGTMEGFAKEQPVPDAASEQDPQVLQDDEEEGSVTWGDDDSTDVDLDGDAAEVQAEMEDLLKELGVFKRKLGDDRDRFIPPARVGRVR